MTTLEYMERQVKKHRINYEREAARGVPEEMLRNIQAKIGHYEAAVRALKGNTAKWIDGADSFGAKQGQFIVCGRCNICFPVDERVTPIRYWQWCPNCGAYMKEVRE